MKNFTQSLTIGIVLIVLSCFTACINDDYGLDNIDRQVVFSQNGLNIPVGDFERIYLNFDLETTLPELHYRKDFENFFTENLYEYFVIERNGIEYGIGDIEFEADFYSYIKNETPVSLRIITQVLDYQKNVILDLGVNDVISSNDLNNLLVQPVTLLIRQEDVIKMKNARVLRFTFVLNAGEVDVEPEDRNFVDIDKMRVKSTGGIKFEI